MYPALIFLHSLFRWIALIALVSATAIAMKGYLSRSVFTPTHNKIRHWTATLLHIQLSIGFLLYFASPGSQPFFAVIHIPLMLIAVLVATFGSALAKRKKTDIEKFKTMAIFFSIALILILLVIPWPFSPWAARPLIRQF